MKERFIGLGLGVSAVLTLGIVWTDSAQAFSLGKTVTVENFLRDPNTGDVIPYVPNPPELPVIDQGPRDVVVGPNRELTTFGGLWDIDLGEASIRFTLTNQVQFNNVTSGDDVYSFLASDFGGPGQNFLAGSTFVPPGNSAFLRKPVINLLAGNKLEVVFPQGFALNLASIPKGELDFRVDLMIREPLPEPTPVPTPVLLPGLLGLGLAALRKKGEDNSVQ